MFRKFSYTLIGLALVLSSQMGPGISLAQEDGTWLEVNQDAEPADSLPLLGQGEYTDYRDGESMGYLLEDSLDTYFLDDIFLPPSIDFEFMSLQDLLRDNMLPEDENFKLTEVFSPDSTMALSIFQLRDEEYPHFHILSNLWIYIWRGRGQLIKDEQELDYGPGQFIQIPAGDFHYFRNGSGAPTIGLIWQSPPIVDSLRMEVIPEEILEQMHLDSLRTLDLQERTIYKTRQ
jgi:quercetin dioxygenase-like cupin family protein